MAERIRLRISEINIELKTADKNSKPKLYAERETLEDEYLYLCSCETHARTRGYMDMD